MHNKTHKRASIWTACELIEQIPGKVSGRPIVRGTRILPDGIVNNCDMGESIEEWQEGFPSLSVDQIKGRMQEGRVCGWRGIRAVL